MQECDSNGVTVQPRTAADHLRGALLCHDLHLAGEPSWLHELLSSPVVCRHGVAASLERACYASREALTGLSDAGWDAVACSKLTLMLLLLLCRGTSTTSLGSALWWVPSLC